MHWKRSSASASWSSPRRAERSARRRHAAISFSGSRSCRRMMLLTSMRAPGDRCAGDVGVVARLTGEGPQRGFVPDDLVDRVGNQARILLEELQLLGARREQMHCIGDGADRGVERRTDVVDHQRTMQMRDPPRRRPRLAPPRQQTVGDELAALIMFGAIAAQRGATGNGQCLHSMPRQPHDWPEPRSAGTGRRSHRSCRFSSGAQEHRWTS